MKPTELYSPKSVLLSDGRYLHCWYANDVISNVTMILTAETRRETSAEQRRRPYSASARISGRRREVNLSRALIAHLNIGDLEIVSVNGKPFERD